MAGKVPFKQCPMCAITWHDRKHFLDDQTLELNGYQADLDKLEKGLFYFTHNIEQCRSTMAIEAGQFYSLNPATPHTVRRTGGDDCPGFCLKKGALDKCPIECECAFVRDIIDIINNYKKN